jgi:hypothetical protein
LWPHPSPAAGRGFITTVYDTLDQHGEICRHTTARLLAFTKPGRPSVTADRTACRTRPLVTGRGELRRAVRILVTGRFRGEGMHRHDAVAGVGRGGRKEPCRLQPTSVRGVTDRDHNGIRWPVVGVRR